MDDRLLAARARLAAGDPDGTIEALRGVDGPRADWLRAVAAAAAGDAVRASVALRAATRDGLALPREALADVAAPFAEALLAGDAAAAAWRGPAATVHHALGGQDVADALHLAWELVVRAADESAGADRAALVVLLAALKRALGRPSDAIDLARGAQEAALDAGAPDVFAGATLLLATLCREDGDDALAADVVRHGRRRLADLGRLDLGDDLSRRWQEGVAEGAIP